MEIAEGRKKVMDLLGHSLEWRVYLDNLKREILDLCGQLKEIPAPHAAHISPDSPGSSGNSQEEAITLQREKLELMVQKKKAAYMRRKILLDTLDNAINNLPPLEKNLVNGRRGHGYERKTWEQLSMENRRANSYCRKVFKEAVDLLAIMVYGAGAE